MPGGQLTLVLKQLRRIVASEPADRSDADLLGRFLQHHDAAAFAGLVERHGRLVWNVCQRLLDHEQDAEDAFQATFLLLAQQARSIRKHESLSSWLYGVAYRVATRARARRQAQRKRTMSLVTATLAQPAARETGWDDLKPILDEEVSRLPRKYRAPVLLCYFEGQTHAEAGRTLGWPTGTVAGRLARARDLLRSRLLRRGLNLSVAGLGALLMENAASASVPELLSLTTTKSAVTFASTGVAAGVSTGVMTLTQGVAKAMMMKKVLVAGCVGLAAVLFVTGGGVSAYVALAGAGLGFAASAGDLVAIEQIDDRKGDKKPEAQTDEELIQGTWELTRRSQATGKLVVDRTLVFKNLGRGGNHFWVIENGVERGSYPYRLDPAKTPKQLDGAERGGGDPALRRVIYALEGDELRLGRSRQGRDFAKSWNGAEVEVSVYHRVGKTETQMIPLKHTDATRIAEIVQGIFKNAEDGPKVTADPRTNSVLIGATAKQLEEIKRVIEKIDNLGAKPEGKPGGRVADLAQERLKVAKEGYASMVANYNLGRVSFRDVVSWSRRVLDCELELATTKEQRVEAMKRYLEALVEYESHAKAAVRTGVLTNADLLDATYQRLDFELRLEQEKAK